MFIHSSILHLSAKLMFNLQHDIEPLTAKSPTCCCLTLPLLERGAIGLSSSSNEVLQSSKPKGNACLHMIHVTASALLPVYSLENEKKKNKSSAFVSTYAKDTFHQTIITYLKSYSILDRLQ